MPTEILVLALGAVLGFVHIMVAGHYKTRQYGGQWNIGPRDKEMPPLEDVAGRLDRARGNFLETFPIAIVAFAGVVIAGKASDLTAICAWIWLAGRLVYLPAYWTGVTGWRTVIWMAATLPVLVTLGALLWP